MSGIERGETRLPLSVIVATTRAWPTAGVSVHAVLSQVRALGAELILADGHGSGFDPALGCDVVWLRIPGAARIDLHARALELARGDVVAITEDHVRPDPDWCSAVLRAHWEQPTVDVIVGSIRDGSRQRVSDRASFLLTSAPYMPPLRQLPERAPPFNNLSVKRRTLPIDPRPGDLEFDVVPALFAAGRIAVDDRVRAAHVQDVSMTDALIMHFHNGRTHGGSFFTESLTMRRRRAREAMRTPRSLTAETRRELMKRPASQYGCLDLATVELIAAAHVVGYLVGLVTGRGNSPRCIT